MPAMKIDIKTGLLDTALIRLSPNCDYRPDRAGIDLIVIHSISLPPGDFGGPWIDDLFANKLDPTVHPYFQKIAGLRLSTHLLIRRNGAIVQYVPFYLRAWHSGESSYAGCSCCNDFSVGIELEGTDHLPYDNRQYIQLSAVVSALRIAYPDILPDRLTGHSEIAPGRKTDPGPAFNWNRLRELLGYSKTADG